MTRRITSIIACLIACLLLTLSLQPKHQVSAAYSCTACVVIVDILQNELADHPDDIQDFLRNKVCGFMPEKYQTVCDFFVTEFEPLLIELMKQHATPSQICNKFKYFDCEGCSLDDPVGEGATAAAPFTSLPPKVQEQMHRMVFLQTLLQERKEKAAEMGSSASMPSSVSDTDIRELIPILDTDKDFFSPVHKMYRGADWRGMDCDDSRSDVRPGLMKDITALQDTNCNGISGSDDTTNQLYEDVFCHSQESAAKSSLRQILMFGDSASSHFHIPPEWFHAQNLTKLLSALDEFDWPQESWSTGFINSINGESVYLKMREKNRCNHRAYQNVGHNGHRAKHFIEEIDALSPVTPHDKPFLAFMAYIGNDVCKHRMDQITTDADFKAQILAGLHKLDKLAPPNSKILTMGLVDATILWNELHNLTHPIGATYAQLYRFLTCTHANPCQTFLTNNATVREYSAKRAMQLSAVLKDTVAEYQGKFQNLEIDYMEFPLAQSVKYIKSIGLPTSILIEPVDGFHPSGYAHRLFSKFVWEFLEKHHSDWLGVDNQYNSDIEKMFGDQGGH